MIPVKKRKNAVQTGKHSARKNKIQIKRVYDEPSPNDGSRFLVDRLWPRGVKKSALSGVIWLRDVAPGTPLRKWFGHDPGKWAEFRKRYRLELEKNLSALKPLRTALQKSNVTLLFAARDIEINHAIVLKEFLQRKGPQGGGKG
jgi:uncharacterized protein YeaO (DUF488 family)